MSLSITDMNKINIVSSQAVLKSVIEEISQWIPGLIMQVFDLRR